MPAPTNTTSPGVRTTSRCRPNTIRASCSSGCSAAAARANASANLKRRQAEQKSILDFVLDDARSVNAKLDGRDRQKLDQYLTSVREIETRIENSTRLTVKNPDIDAPAGIPDSYEEHVALMFDMLALAFQTDSTRVATMLISREGSNRSFADIGIASGHHDLTHHKNSPEIIEKVKLIDRWYMQRFAKFLEKMQSTEDVDGKSLLDHSMILYGSGNADGNRHTHEDLPIVLAGGGSGAFKPGRYREDRRRAHHQPVPQHGRWHGREGHREPRRFHRAPDESRACFFILRAALASSQRRTALPGPGRR